MALNTPDDVFRTFRALASRNTASTTMNHSSSRSHCFVFLNLYAYKDGRVRCSRFNFCDMAGSERLKEAHGGKTNVREGTIGMYQGMAVNWSLMMLSRCIRELVELRRRKRKFAHLAEVVSGVAAAPLPK